ncbi:YkgJ family cysteine cluster protein [Hydrogenophaga laconesensis]|uniref:Zinc-or iron-chelating domain-containing protein n=1 Tax=Hydrogenophaga laconesensis TaxID=1805971 RepID=A0ABU1VJ87_9BURK|nr:YkgJ family cysteine cluster protein [Hydrogenophaga laconesensis]MDR7097548.1 hypothetical protein [Hydrogenophaga laconesensis]
MKMDILPSPTVDGGGTLEARIADALRSFVEGVALNASEDFPDEVNDRLAGVAATAEAAMGKVSGRARDDVTRLPNVSVQASTKPKNVLWLHRAADAFAAAIEPVAACRAGCSHCCHIPIKISATEARAIGKAIGRSPLPLQDHHELSTMGYDAPCTFLKDSTCSIRNHRPAVCRTHFNVDVDDLLCQLVDVQGNDCHHHRVK